jgi:hypothetical protein
MKTTILQAVTNLSSVSNFELKSLYHGENKMNNVGTALEYFVKDMFCSTLDVSSIREKDRKHSDFLSYLGNQNNPPDFILKDGDAVEVKKIKTLKGDIQLNSSHPKLKLYSGDSRIKKACRESDGGDWHEKDVIYTVGSVVHGRIKVLWFVYGSCYAADNDVYESTFDRVSSKIASMKDLDFNKTNEIGRINSVDPLGITYLRVRGMWGIRNPHAVFGHLTDFDSHSEY